MLLQKPEQNTPGEAGSHAYNAMAAVGGGGGGASHHGSLLDMVFEVSTG